MRKVNIKQLRDNLSKELKDLPVQVVATIYPYVLLKPYSKEAQLKVNSVSSGYKLPNTKAQIRKDL